MRRYTASIVLAAVSALVPACAGNGAESSSDLVRIDGIQYSRAQAAERFGNQDLHWIITQEVLDEGIPTAFTSEDKRNAAVGIRADQLQRGDDSPKLLERFATLYRNDDRGGGSKDITGSLNGLGDFNDKASSVDTFGRDIVLYEHANHLGCSLFVQRQKYIAELDDHDFCGLFTGNWNDKASSVSVVGQ